MIRWTKKELAAEFGISPHTIDKYRKLGYIPKTIPPRGTEACYYQEHFEAVVRVITRRERNFVIVGDGDPYGDRHNWRKRWRSR